MEIKMHTSFNIFPTLLAPSGSFHSMLTVVASVLWGHPKHFIKSGKYLNFLFYVYFILFFNSEGGVIF